MTNEIAWKDSAREEVRDIYSYLFDIDSLTTGQRNSPKK